MGRAPTHIDSHRHVHRQANLFPEFCQWAAPLNVPVRGEGPVRFVGGFYAQWEWKVTELKYVSVPALQQMIRTEVLAGVTEFSCHPGYVQKDYSAVYNVEREEEIRTLTHRGILQTIEEEKIRLISYADYNRLRAGIPADC
jgi:predicted glycoside hydrolase/deacetylase ChbG (UPF0249 family)